MTDIALDRYIPLTTRRKPGEPPWLTPAVKRITSAYVIVKSKTKTRQNVGPLKVNDKLVTGNEDMAKALNSFFTSVFTREAPGPVPPCPKLPSASTLDDMWIDSNTVKKNLLKLKPSSAPGPDNMTARFLIMNASALAPTLAIIYNESLRSGFVPED